MNRLFLHRKVLPGIACLALATTPASHLTAFAQSTSAGTLVGSVVDPSGAVIPGATITVTDLSTTKDKLTTTSNKDGQYVLTNVPPGTYRIDVTRPGFAIDQIASIAISVGTQTTANFKLAIGAESTTIEVQASNADLQTLNASTGQTVDAVMVESLPAIGRDVATFVTMQPGVAPGGQVAGTTADQATFQLDGGSNSSDMDGTAGVYTSNNVNTSVGGALAGGKLAHAAPPTAAWARPFHWPPLPVQTSKAERRVKAM